MTRVAGLALACCLLVGCASLDPWRQPPAAQRLLRDDVLGDCARFLQYSDSLIDAAGTRDAQAVRVPGFPYLRVDRTLARLGEAVDGHPQRVSEWTAALAAEDEAARSIELRNAGYGEGWPPPLPHSVPSAALPQATAATEQLQSATSLADCRRRLLLADQQQLPSLLDVAQVPDDYSTTQRALGLYPLTRYAFAAGIRGWQRDTLAEFSQFSEVSQVAAAAAGAGGHPRRRYIPAAQLDSLPVVQQAPALGLPPLSPHALSELIVRHAPRFEIETADDNDRPGMLVWQGDPGGTVWRIGVDSEQAALFVRTAHTQLAGRWRLQLVYGIWFPARPPEHAYDVLAGRLDGLVWRVTLDEDGKPLLYDSIHPCGCYHLFIPTERVRARPQPQTIDEGLFVAQNVRAPVADERTVLHLASRTHYLQRVRVEALDRHEDSATVILALRDDDQLRALPLPGGGARSAFGPDGLIAGSERLERFYFWPMGIASAGQMRQWGRHATAFVGRRHFDDPTLIDRYFERLP